MLEHVVVKNLRSIGEVKVHPGLITVLYGPNGSGKSTLIHALSVFKNVLMNPGLPVDRFFNVGFTDFGGFQEVVSRHLRHQSIEIEVGCSHDSAHVAQAVNIGATSISLSLTARDLRPLPDRKPLEFAVRSYPGEARAHVEIRLDADGASWELDWNGVATSLRSSGGRGAPEAAGELIHTLNAPSRTVQHSEFVPLKRGFSKAHYGRAARGAVFYGEDRLAEMLFTQRALEKQVDRYLRQVVRYSLNAKALPPPDQFVLETTDQTTGLTTGLVNEGSGINQVVYLLTKSLLRDASVVSIEEPEIHLHPNALRRLAYALIDIAKTEDRIFIISTHSENLVVALLGAVAQEKIEADQLACYLVTKKDGQSTFDRQGVTSTGQIEGGLRSFMEAQLEDLRHILGIADHTE